MGDRAEKEAFVTLATNDTYALGCLVLANSLVRVQTNRKLVVMVTPGVSNSMRNQLSGVFDMVTQVDLLDSLDEQNLALLGRPDLNVTFTKLHCWRLTMFDKCVFLDADTLVVQNVDELFDREELSASPDAGWPDCFNSGVFVFRPNEETYQSLLCFAISTGSFDGGDQGLLNLYFHNWAHEDISKHLPFTYNVVSQAFYSYLPAFRQFKNQVKIIHFIGATKPWHHSYSMATGCVTVLSGTGHNEEYLQIWWDIFMERVQPSLDPLLTGLAGDLAHMQLLETASGCADLEQRLLSDRERKLNWERGQMDYLGQDAFTNIQAKLDTAINGNEPQAPEPAPESAPAPIPVPVVRSTATPMVTSQAQPTQKPAQQVVPKPAQQVVQKPAQQVAQKPAQTVAQKPAQPVVQKPAQPVAQKPAQKTAQPVAQKTAQPVAQKTAQKPAQPVAQKPAQPAVQKPAQQKAATQKTAAPSKPAPPKK